jgi:DNA-binding CsgD family transcriptional regulator
MSLKNFRQQQLQGLDTAQQCWRLYVDHGLTTRQIGAELGISGGAVSKALRRAEKLGLETLRQSVSTHKTLQLARLERLYMIAMDAWDRSVGAQTAKVTKTVKKPAALVLPDPAPAIGDPAGGAREATTPMVTETRTETRTMTHIGNAAYLETARGCLSDMRKLLGLDAPIKVRQVDQDRPYEDLSDDDVRRELAALLVKAGIDPTMLAIAGAAADGLSVVTAIGLVSTPNA